MQGPSEYNMKENRRRVNPLPPSLADPTTTPPPARVDLVVARRAWPPTAGVDKGAGDYGARVGVLIFGNLLYFTIFCFGMRTTYTPHRKIVIFADLLAQTTGSTAWKKKVFAAWKNGFSNSEYFINFIILIISIFKNAHFRNIEKLYVCIYHEKYLHIKP